MMGQVELTPFPDTDRAIATSIVDAVDDTGYLTIQIEDIVDSIGDDEIGLEEVEAVLKRIQRFDPVGVAAKDLRDCLLIQLSQFAKETPWLEEARVIISDHLDLLANHDFRTLMRVTRLKEEVLKAVNRRPSLLPLQEILQILRASGATVNFDFIYGLPLQSVDSFRKTIEQASALRPDRLVTCSYAHLPKLFPRQQILDRMGLPATEEKNRMYETASEILRQAGYQSIGLDHFVLPDDELYTALQTGRLHRNFQGYCTRRTTAQVYAFGVTAISQLDDAYAQNGREIKAYIETIGKDRLYTSRGYQLSAEQKLIREVVETLMCNYTLDWNDVAERTGTSVAQLRKPCHYDEERLREMASDGILVFDDHHITVNTDGRPFVRCVAAALDPLMQHTDKHFSNPI